MAAQPHGAPDPGRIAEVVAFDTAGRPVDRGSGYRVSATQVLTAAHVLPTTRVEVRFPAGEPAAGSAVGWSTVVLDRWADPNADLAVLTIEPRPQEPPVPAVSYGRLPEVGRAVVPVHAAGFPRWKVRYDPENVPFRELHHAIGRVAVLSNRRTARWEITVEPPATDPDPGRSAWEGMSGAALWADGHLVGVVVEHHPREGQGRLTAVPLSPDALRRLGCSTHGPDLAIAAGASQVRSAYAEHVGDIAPDALQDRESELDELAEFCAGGEPYLWWQAPPWSGKTALLSTFAANPPAGVDVVSFFVTGRLAAQSDSDAFTAALLDQLSALLGEDERPALAPAARDPYRRHLLRRAAENAAHAGRRIVLVVDGLDEDAGTAPGSRLPSIASLLPKRPEPTLRVILAGRPHPPIPSDVPEDHPVRRCRIRLLKPSPHAQALADKARAELGELLAGDRIQQDIVGMIAASGGGLSQADLSELTGHPPFTVAARIRSFFGRTVTTRDATWVPDDTGPVYLFAHDTLRETAEEQLGHGLLANYRERIHDWADRWRTAGWPPHTPTYLLSTYPRIAAADGAWQRLAVCATDTRRQERLLATTGGDAASLTEIGNALNLAATQPEPDLPVVVELAVNRERLIARNSNAPTDLAAVWATLGHLDRAMAVADSITEKDRRDAAIVAVVEASTTAGFFDHAAQAAASITCPDRRAFALGHAVEVATDAGEFDAALTLADAVTDPERRGAALLWIAEAVPATAGVVDRLARIDPATPMRASALRQIARAAAAAGDYPTAVTTARSGGPDALAAVVDAALARGDLDDALAAAESIEDPDRRGWALALVADGFLYADRASRAVDIAAGITNESLALGVVRRAAQQALHAGDYARALAVSADTRAAAGVRFTVALAAGDYAAAAEAAAEMSNACRRDDRLTLVVRLAAAAGTHEAARTAAGLVADDWCRYRAFGHLAVGLARTGDVPGALQAAGVGTARLRVPVHLAIIEHLLATAEHSQAEHLTRQLLPPPLVSLMLARIAESAAAIGRLDDAIALTHDIAYPRRWVTTSRLARNAAAAGRYDLAYELAQSLPDGDCNQLCTLIADRARFDDQFDALPTELRNRVEAQVAPAPPRTAPAGPQRRMQPIPRLERLLKLAEVARHGPIVARVDRLRQVAHALARAGHPDHAAMVASDITHPEIRVDTLIEVVRIAAELGLLGPATAIARGVVSPTSRVIALAVVLDAAADRSEIAIVDDLLPEVRDALAGLRHLDQRHVDVLVAIARASIAAGDHAAAADAALRIGGQQHKRVAALVAIAKMAVVAARPDVVTDLFKRIVGGLKPLSAPVQRQGYGTEVSVTVHRKGWTVHEESLNALVDICADVVDLPTAAAAAARFASGSRLDELLVDLVCRARDAGAADVGIDLAVSIDDRHLRTHVLAVLADALLARGDYGGAVSATIELPEDAGRGERLSTLAEHAAVTGHQSGVDAALRALDGTPCEPEALTAVARAHGVAGRTEQAQDSALAAADTTRQAAEVTWHAPGLSALVDALLAADRPADAAALPTTVADPDLALRLLTTVGTAFVLADDLAAALQLTHHIPAEDRTSRFLAAIAETLISAGRYRDAPIAADRITQPDAADAVLAEVIAYAVDVADLPFAEQTVGRIRSPQARDAAMVRMIRARVSEGELTRAAAMTASMNANRERTNALAAVVSAMVTSAHPDGDRMFAVLREQRLMESPDALVPLAEELLKADRIDEALVIAESLGTIAESLTDWGIWDLEQSPAWSWYNDEGEARLDAINNELVRRLAAGNRMDDARRVATRMRGTAALTAQTALARAAVAGMRYGSAAFMLDELPNLVAVPVLAELAGAAAERGDYRAALPIFQLLAERTNGNGLADLARTRADVGDSHAITLCEMIAGQTHRVRVLTDVAERLARTAGPTVARTAVEAILDDRVDRALAWTHVLRGLADGGRTPDALALLPEVRAAVTQIRDLRQREGALSALAAVVIAAGRPVHADQLIAEITTPTRRDAAWAGSAEEAARKGNPRQALACADRITDPDRRTAALVRVVEKLTSTHQTAAATDLVTVLAPAAESFSNPGRQAWALSVLAWALAAAGDPTRAFELMDRIADPALRRALRTALEVAPPAAPPPADVAVTITSDGPAVAPTTLPGGTLDGDRALITVAVLAADASGPDPIPAVARRTVASVLRGPYWTEALRALAQVDRAAFDLAVRLLSRVP
ncbi:trypsin-like peptidase domain-containing protein [Virgisporangium aurantiacum]|uniref:Nephrocystin 3-like N-terminal domain-containing protein n=1 Tax=Virgisporangium aurantiacum TaxID=175570 RepID=A0A8J3ZK49_9ACTN|nr:trypsin-like peptidase domain-containing protein [Virgisporangium aurantiacum]GIJ63435.1 hypothetical protein Vau01_109510 [Virgisporangium aurantiacum]